MIRKFWFWISFLLLLLFGITTYAQDNNWEQLTPMQPKEVQVTTSPLTPMESRDVQVTASPWSTPSENLAPIPINAQQKCLWIGKAWAKQGTWNLWSIVPTCKCPEKTKSIDWYCMDCDHEWVCCGIKLNTEVPFIGNCIRTQKTDKNPGITQEEAFPTLMGWLMKILMTVIVLGWFIAILIAWVMITSSGGTENRAKQGRDLIIKVVIAFALLWASGVILRLINPNFFG